jgi:hypothetical protein
MQEFVCLIAPRFHTKLDTLVSSPPIWITYHEILNLRAYYGQTGTKKYSKGGALSLR